MKALDWFNGTEHLYTCTVSPPGWKSWIHNNAACIDEYHFESEDGYIAFQATAAGVLDLSERIGADLSRPDVRVVLLIANMISAELRELRAALKGDE
jgi:hypothetical protein